MTLVALTWLAQPAPEAMVTTTGNCCGTARVPSPTATVLLARKVTGMTRVVRPVFRSLFGATVTVMLPVQFGAHALVFATAGSTLSVKAPPVVHGSLTSPPGGAACV